MATASRCWSPEISILPRYTSCAMPPSVIDASRSDDSSLALSLRALKGLLDDPNTTELCINRPGEAFVESTRGWRREALPHIGYEWCVRFAKLVANNSGQRVDAAAPLLSAALPSGERVQIVMPPATTPGTV